MDVDLADLAAADVRGRQAFTVAPEHCTNVFGDQSDPPARPAAADADPDEAIRVLGTPHLVARVEFVGRDSLHGHLPDGTGTVGERLAVDHRRPAPVGTDLVVETVVTAAEGRRLSLDGRVTAADGDAPGEGAVVGEGEAVFRVVDRDRFRASLGEG